MSEKNTSNNELAESLKIHRRDIMKHAVAFGVATAVTPAISKYAAAAGELNVLMWDDELDEKIIAAFEKATQIKVNFLKFGANEEMINKLKAGNGDGVDIFTPTMHRSPQLKDLGVAAPIDMKRLEKTVASLNPVMVKAGNDAWNFGKGSTYLPHVWGTEGISWRTDKWNPKGGEPSYGDLWSKENEGKMMGRPHSIMLTLGLWLETQGKLPKNAMWDAYKGPEQMAKAWDVVTKYAIDNKKQVKTFWKSGAAPQKDGLLNQGVVVAQTWEGPIFSMKNEGNPVNYRAPKEGALAWVDGLCISTKCQNIDGAYKFIEMLLNKELAGKAIDFHNYNSVVLGADAIANANYAKNFKEGFPGDALAKLNPWPSEPQWYADKRTEYENKFASV